MNPPLRLKFSSRRRISRSSDFARLKEEGRREICGSLILNWLPAKQLRLGVVTSRKVGSAVIRSRARRLLREVFRQHQHEVIEPVSIVLVARHSIADNSLETVRRDYLRALSKAKLRKPSSSATATAGAYAP
jgi:ribonuclease P protein component